MGSPGGLQYSLSYYSADFNYLDPSCLYYNLYIDGEVVTFSPDDYANLTEEMTDVPYASPMATSSISMTRTTAPSISTRR